MIVDRSIAIEAPPEETYQRVLDIPFVGSCLPGAADVRDDGDGSYRGRFSVRVGPVTVKLEGKVRVTEAYAEERRAVIRLEGADRSIGGNVAGNMDVRVLGGAGGGSELVVHTDITISGRIGQFGQAVVLKKADQITEGFVQEFSRRLVQTHAGLTALTPLVSALTSEWTPAPSARPGSVSVSSGLVVSASNEPAPSLLPLFRRGRRLLLTSTCQDVGRSRRSKDVGALWVTQGASVGPRGRDAYPRVAGIGATGTEDLQARLRQLDTGDPDAVAAIAVTPRGAAAGDPGLTSDLCRVAAETTGRAVILVASAPWAALAAARTAAFGTAHGVAVVLAGGADDPYLAALMVTAIGEVQAAGLNIPMMAGPVPEGSVARLLAAGADGVIVEPRIRTRPNWASRKN